MKPKSPITFSTTAVLLLLSVAAVTSFAADSVPSDVTASAMQFVGLLWKEDFTKAVAQFDSTMKAALPEAKLREMSKTLLQQAGQFKRQMGTTAEKQAGYDVVLVTCQFEHTTLDTKVVFNSSKQIAGLFFVPSRHTAASSALPPYARTNAFREKAFTVGTGEWRLPGTLTLPVISTTAPVPAVVLVHGSGPNDRDETVGANKPFRDLALGLASKGIAVLRYEKRTKEYSAKLVAGGLGKLTVQEETIDDALAAVAQLRTTDGIDPRRVFVLGHSLGGLVAPRIGQADQQLAGLIILAGSTRPLEDLMVEQTRYLLSLNGEISADGQAKLDQMMAEAKQVKGLTVADATSPNLLLHAPPQYWLDLRAHDPVADAKTLKQPLLILQGQRDYQVTQADFDRWKTGLGNQPNVTFKLYPKLNHLFMSGEGKSTPAEYDEPGHVDATVVADIAEWIFKPGPAP